MKREVEVTDSTIGPLRWIKLRGSRRDVFRWLGAEYRDVIANFLDQPSERERATRARRSPHVEPVLAATRLHLPRELSETEAVAEGANVPVEELLLLNIRGDIGVGGEGCSDLALSTDRACFFAHNEDAEPAHEGDCPLLTLHVDGEPPLLTFWYPGMVAAMTFWLNGAGIGCGVDHVPVREPGAGVGRQFLARALAGAASLDELVDLARRTPVAGGYTYIVGTVRERRLACVEVGPRGVDVQPVVRRHAHTNHFVFLPERQVVEERSVARLDLLNALAEPDAPQDALRAFANPSKGIWRDARDGDPLVTLCSVVFDFDARVVLFHPRGGSGDHALGFDELTSADP